jgi:hypothetical protein
MIHTLSYITVSAPFRGTQVVYTLGEQVDRALSVRPFSVGAFLARGVHAISYLSPLLPFIDLHSECRSLSFNDISFAAFLKQLWCSEWAESKDAAPYDTTFQASDEREANLEGVPYEATFYMSFATLMVSTLHL